jgi:hypothetical protein
MKHRVLLLSLGAVSAVLVALLLLFEESTTGPAPLSRDPVAAVAPEEMGSLPPVEGLGRPESEAPGRVEAGTRALRLVDAHTGLALAECAVFPVGPDGANPEAVDTAADGALSVPRDTEELRPADGFAFAPVRLEGDAASDGTLEVRGQFRISASGPGSGEALVALDRSPKEWHRFLEADRPEEGTVGALQPGDGAWTVFPTHSAPLALASPGHRVVPGHPAWVGFTEELGGGRVRGGPPSQVGPSQVSRPFTAQPGQSLTFTTEVAFRKALVQFFTSREEWTSASVSLVSNQKTEHSVMRRRFATTELDPSTRSAEFTDVPEGDYFLTSWVQQGEVLHLSAQPISVGAVNGSYSEEAGTGSFSLAFDCDGTGWRLHSIGTSDPDLSDSMLIPIRRDLDGISSLAGLVGPRCRLAMEGPDTGVIVRRLDVRSTPRLDRFEE